MACDGAKKQIKIPAAQQSLVSEFRTGKIFEVTVYIYTSSTAQGGGGSFKNRKPIGEVGCGESGMAERIN